jgi:sulfite reductase (NADPH) flavoprotein alpha-component
MTMSVNPADMPALTLIPENAPFSAEQRAWLSGFLAAVLVPGIAAPQDSPTTTTLEETAAPLASNDAWNWRRIDPLPRA